MRGYGILTAKLLHQNGIYIPIIYLPTPTEKMISPNDINHLAQFLAHEQIPTPPPENLQTDVLVLCVSALLDSADAVFTALNKNPEITKTLILCGGIGHSTSHLYAAIAKHPVYHVLFPTIQDQPEARVLHTVLTSGLTPTPTANILKHCRILVEDKSTNCGANASNTYALLQKHGIPLPCSMVIVQDPTMARRTVASFAKVFGEQTQIRSWPTFVPRVRMSEGEDGETLVMEKVEEFGVDRMWDLKRFVGLLEGEIPRLRDDEEGYGPTGKGFITHVDVPEGVLEAWERVRKGGLGAR